MKSVNKAVPISGVCVAEHPAVSHPSERVRPAHLAPGRPRGLPLAAAGRGECAEGGAGACRLGAPQLPAQHTLPAVLAGW